MKENNVRSFEHYQQMIEQSKSKPKLQTQQKKSAKILKSFNPSDSSLNKSSQQKTQPNQNSSNKSPAKDQSPNRHKNKSHSPAKKVSYAELQLILQNIDMIKNRARQQIEALQVKNTKLEDEIQMMREKYEGAKKSQTDMERERKKISDKFENVEKDYQKRWHEVQLRQRIWAQQKQQYIQQILNFKESIRIDLAAIKDLEQTLEKQSSQKEEWKNKYEFLVSLLTARKPQRITELMYQMKQNYEGWAVLDIFSDRQKKVIVLQKQLEKVQSQKTRLQQLLSEEKSQRAKTQEILDKLMAENKSLLSTISSKEQEYKKSLNLLNQELSNQRQTNLNLSQQLHSLQNEYKSRLAEIQSLKQTVASLLQKMQSESVRMKEITQKTQLSNINRKYFNVVDQECEELEDISRVLAKMEVLEKCKIQNRLNVEKIQFLCKMLDC